MAEVAAKQASPSEATAAGASPKDTAAGAQGGSALEIDEDDTDSGFSGADNLSYEIASRKAGGSPFGEQALKNGRKYATLRDDYWGPSDEQQFETMDAGHLLFLVMNSDHSNMLFRAPVKDPEYILDLGTGPGTWAVDAADKFPDTQVYGVDIYPPPAAWVPPNCILEVDDVLNDWTWKHQFDLIHVRQMLGAFTEQQWDKVYRSCYEHLKPGGWIEQIELDVRVYSDDDSLSPDSLIAGWGPNFLGCAARNGRRLDTQETMRGAIERAGFTNVHEILFKVPIGAWPKNRTLKEAGRINHHHWSSGLDGWAVYLLTKFGAPTPWPASEVRTYVAKVRQELKNPKLHIWHYSRRVWAQKPE